MLTATRTLTVGDLRQVIHDLPDFTPVVVRAHINDVPTNCKDFNCSCPSADYSGELTIEHVHQAINCIELHACD